MGNFIDSHITGRKKFVSDDNNPNLVTVPYDASLDLSGNFTINIMLNTLSINSFIAEQENSWKLETVNGALRLTLYDSGLNTLIFTSDSAIVNSSIDKLYSLVWDNTAKTFTAYTNAVLEGYTQTGTGTIGTFVVNNPTNPITIFQKTGENTFLGEFIYFGIESEAYTSVQIGTLYSEIENAGQVPDSQDIVFVSNETGTAQIHKMTVNGQDRQKLTSTAGTKNYPTWNWDDERVIYENNGNSSRFVDGNGGVDTLAQQDGRRPCWAINANSLPDFITGYTHGRDGVNTWYRYDSTTGIFINAWNLANLLWMSPDSDATESFAANPSVSSQMLGVRTNGANYEILTIRAFNGLQPLGVKRTSANQISKAKLNRNRTKMGWSELVSGVWQIFISDPDGSNLNQITAGTDNYIFNALSPDGTKILAHSDKTGNNQLYTMDINGANIKNISNNSFEEYSGDWK